MTRAEAKARAPLASRGRRVLIVEDNADAAQSLREVLEMGAHTVELAFDGKQGLAKAREFGPEIVLCDIGLPLMNGYELARAVRADQDLQHLYLVALTGYALPEDKRSAREAGFDQHLAKPPNIEVIEALLQSVPERTGRRLTIGRGAD